MVLMLVSDSQVFALVLIALVVGVLALQLGNELYKA
uniref:Photosystem I reaction center subunit XII n=1 Tax=prasinophyte sp. MBIC10622 TaxID=156113 RepID=A0A088CKJ9_9CHLO|nr:M polypeptide of photosystem I [prasinophyte sp. MBIC10622]